MSATALFLTAPYADSRIISYCYNRLKEAADMPIITADQPEGWPRGHISLYKNLLSGLALVETSHVYICEHDCIYTPEYFTEDGTEKRWSYSNNIEYLTRGGFVPRTMLKTGTLSTMYGNTTAILTAIAEKLHEANAGTVKWTEPGDARPLRFASRIIDIRHGSNYTGKRRGKVYDYERAAKIWKEIEQC